METLFVSTLLMALASGAAGTSGAAGDDASGGASVRATASARIISREDVARSIPPAQIRTSWQEGQTYTLRHTSHYQQSAILSITEFH